MPSSRSSKPTPSPSNQLERVACAAAGVLLVIPVLRRRSWWRYVAAASGGALIYNGLSGRLSFPKHLLDQAPTSPVTIRHSITIGRNAVDLSSMWRDPDVIGRVMQPFGEVEIVGTGHLRWTLGDGARRASVDCTLGEDRPGELVQWKSIPTAGLRVDEQMRFRPAPEGRGTEASLQLEVDLSNLPAGAILSGLASFFHQPADIALRKVLHNFRSLAETGEIPTLERNPSARADGKSDGDLV